jgi:hypothetical protein
MANVDAGEYTCKCTPWKHIGLIGHLFSNIVNQEQGNTIVKH